MQRTQTAENDVYQGLQPRELWKHFAALNRIPRPSGKETGARDYVQHVASSVGAESKVDARGNIIVYAPSTRSDLDVDPIVAIQTHLDMVCEKRPEVIHDFEKDSIVPRREGDCIFASGTTLGADNGIGVAAALSLLTDRSLQHGPLELIFTVEEETGLYGAFALDPALVSARLLINLDTEDSEELIVGSAGGATEVVDLTAETEKTPGQWIARKVVVSGLRGGHSGLQIHEHLANAIKLLSDALLTSLDSDIDFRLISIDAGNADNAIPRQAEAQIAISPSEVPLFEKAMAQFKTKLCSEWIHYEPDLLLDVREAEVPRKVLTNQSRDAVLHLLQSFPHGVSKMSRSFPGKVETSSNLAMVNTHDCIIRIVTSFRSFVPAEIEKLIQRTRSMATAAGARIEVRDVYPGWRPHENSQLLKLAIAVWREIRGEIPKIDVSHGGLECGVIVNKIPGMEAISFGPRIKFAHTPKEHVFASTVVSMMKILVALLAAVSRMTEGNKHRKSKAFRPLRALQS